MILNWKDPDRLGQLRALIDPKAVPPPAGPSFADAVLNAVVFVALVAGMVFVVAVLLGLVGL